MALSVARLTRDPSVTGLCTDFDGTLAAIVPDPGDARPIDGAVELLGRLAARFARVAVVSGRPVSFLLDHLGSRSAVTLVGLYGMEWSERGAVVEHPDAGQWRATVAAAADAAEAAAPDGVTIERKGLSVTVHVRSAPEHQPWVRSWAEAEAARTGLLVRPARMSVELQPPVAVDKGVVVERLLAGLDAACFMGDDVGDLPAFDALDRLEAAGVGVVRVAVTSTEAPPALLERADLVVDGPEGALGLLGQLGAGG
jgi:trehalose 6-phosphate phosphatase